MSLTGPPLALLLFLLPLSLTVYASPTNLHDNGKLGIIGPSLASATNSSQMCGNTDAFECLQVAAGAHSREWSHASGSKSWWLLPI